MEKIFLKINDNDDKAMEVTLEQDEANVNILVNGKAVAFLDYSGTLGRYAVFECKKCGLGFRNLVKGLRFDKHNMIKISQ